MMKRFFLCDVEVRKYRYQKQKIRSAIVALDVKIEEFKRNLENTRYSSSSRALSDLSEIVGELKFLYVSGIVTPVEYRKIFCNLTGEEYEEEVV